MSRRKLKASSTRHRPRPGQVVSRAEHQHGCQVAFLHVITHNQGAVRFYRGHGFSSVKRLVNFYVLPPEKSPESGRVSWGSPTRFITARSVRLRSPLPDLRSPTSPTLAGDVRRVFIRPPHARGGEEAGGVSPGCSGSGVGRVVEVRRGGARGVPPPPHETGSNRGTEAVGCRPGVQNLHSVGNVIDSGIA